MKNSPYLDKPLRSEREAKMEVLLRRMVADLPWVTHPPQRVFAVEEFVGYIHEAKEILK